MAGDLIPPPSPAGRPAPDPDYAGAFEPVPEEPGTGGAPPPDPGPSPFRARFGFVTGALVGCAIAAGVVLLALLTAGDPQERDGLAPNWSQWKPDSSEAYTGAEQIAEHVGEGYFNEKHKQLANVGSGPIAVAGIPLAVAVPEGEKTKVLDEGGIQYTLGGFGKEGRLEGSKPGEQRHRLLRREALELALYSFRYLPEVKMVVALLPPASAKAERIGKAAAKKKAKDDVKPQRQALFYRSDELESQLKVPLRLTLAAKPPAIGELTTDEARRVDSLTNSNVFEWTRVQLPDGRVFLALRRPS